MKIKSILLSLLTLALVFSGPLHSAPKKKVDDPHQTAAGFFDLHVCNWPDRPLFFLALFSTTQFDNVASVEVVSPVGQSLGTLNLERYKVVKKKGKPEKRIFITQIPVPKGAMDGWYLGKVTLRNGRRYEARDRVLIQSMGRASNTRPAHESQNIPVPKELRWDAIPGAKYYQVFIHDLWDDGKLIHTSKFINTPRYILPKGLLQKDGWYAWRVHARDVNEDVELGDFNHGSLNTEVNFTTKH